MLILEPAAGDFEAPAVVRLRKLLKATLRGYGWRCRDAHRLDELDQLRRLVTALAERIADQSEALSRAAERRPEKKRVTT